MEKKLRHSRQREMICEYLMSSCDHPSAEMIFDALREKLPNISLGTVYRNLKLLEETGQIRKVTTYQNTDRYDARSEDHAHFVCSCCGCVKDLAPLDAASASSSCHIDPGDKVQWMNVIFGGTCAACMNR
ncbi:MAG: transcriptional repressor [Ruminococcaceae bacterium]|nr:transcriptional repressor [Oscillospiraceae bacterium]